MGRRVAGLGVRELEMITGADRMDEIARPLQRRVRHLLASPGGRVVKDFLNGTWLGHPLHPIFTDLPLGTWTAAVAFDAATATGRTNLDRGARASLLVGIAGAVGAALSGLADWSDTNKEQRRIGLVHGAANSVALLLQIGSFVGRGRGWRSAKLMSLFGLGAAMSAAYLGGNLVYRLGTQVDRTAWSGGLKRFTPAMAEADLQPERPTRAEVEGVPVMMIRHQGELYAMEDTCGHAGCSLSQGRLENGSIVCACHGSTYRLSDGAVLHGPSPFAQPTFDARVENGRIALRRRPL
ncbi:MAG TPA: Rieske 2Fe-2S domain-containing protein [Vulgatibacter sp.]|nr:Rieske 2Fe-2S domain-containing protein [Vulgatibacter sp.]